MSKEEMVLQVEGVTKSYLSEAGAAPQQVLRGVDLAVGRGEFVALMGSSGSGKSTLLNLVGGLDAPDSGTIVLEGQELARLSDALRSDLRLRRVGFVFQFFNLLPNLSAVENVELPLLFARHDPREARAKSVRLLDEVGLADKAQRPAHKLSGGEMQRVALARALVGSPALLLADEPTGNLDSVTGAVILDLVSRVAREHGVTILMATHDEAVAARADRIVRMRDGRVVEGGAA